MIRILKYILIYNNTHIYQIIKMFHTFITVIFMRVLLHVVIIANTLPNTYYVPSTTLSILTDLILTIPFRGRLYSHPHFTKFREFINLPKITQLVNSVAQIQYQHSDSSIYTWVNRHVYVDSFRCVC